MTQQSCLHRIKSQNLQSPVTSYQCSTQNPVFAMSLTIVWRHVAAGSLPETEFFQMGKVFLQT